MDRMMERLIRSDEEVALSNKDIFISYSRDDRFVAKHVAECFEAEGFSVWWDAALHSGQAFDEVIEAELRAAKAVVVLWSPRSVASRWVRAEATLADRLNKLAPVIIETCERPIIFELTHTTDLSDWNGDPGDPLWRAFLQDLLSVTLRGDPNGIAAAHRSVASQALQEARAESIRVSGARTDGLASKLMARVGAGTPVVASAVASPHASGFFPSSQPLNRLGDEFHCLEVTSGGRLEKRFVVSPMGLRIGRTAPSDVIIADRSVSRAHCLVELADDRLQVTDLRSTNGTFIDGRRIDDRAWLDVGSVMRVGSMDFKHAVRRRAEV